MSVVVSLAARKEPRAVDSVRRRAPDSRGAQVVILPCVRREMLKDEVVVLRLDKNGTETA